MSVDEQCWVDIKKPEEKKKDTVVTAARVYAPKIGGSDAM